MRKTEFIQNMSHWLGHTRHCKICQKAMAEISKEIKNGNEAEVIIRPDKNAFGNITHHHIEIKNK